MSKKHCGLMFVLLPAVLLIYGEACNEAPRRELAVGKKGNVETIVIPEKSNQVTRMAASELQRYMKEITGKELVISEGKAAANGEGQVMFELSRDTSIKWDGFIINNDKRNLNITAREPRGLLYAVYTLLEQSGCSFFYPGEREQVIPRKEMIAFNPGIQRFNPILEHRGLAPYGIQASSVNLGKDFIDWMAKNKLNYILVSENRPSDSDGPANGSIWREVTGKLLPELTKRGVVIEMSEHCTSTFFPSTLFNQHPTWFAMNGGKRKVGKPPYSGQMCYSNKDAVEYYGNALAKYAAAHPEFHVIGTWPLDGGNYCECEQCKDPETYFKASMRVAEKIKAVRPDMVVEYLAYQGQYQAPKMRKIPANMSVLWCPDPGDKMDTLKQWIEKAGDAGGVEEFEYLMGDNYRARCNVWLRPEFSAGIPQQAQHSGFRGIISLFLPMQNWWRAAFNNSFFAKACWTPQLNTDSVLVAYCKAYYPGCDSAVHTIMRSVIDSLQQEPYHVPDPQTPANTENMEAASASILRNIDTLLSKEQDQTVKLRLNRLKAFVEFSTLHQRAFASGKKPDYEKMVAYAEQHPEQDMVIMYPGYVKWRTAEYFQ